MKTLYLMRHAKSSWNHPGIADHDRPLNERGNKAAPQMAQKMIKEGIHPGLVLCSTAYRTKETAQHLIKEYSKENIPLKVEYHSDLYHAGPETILKLVSEQSHSHESLLVIAHNPGLEELVEQLSEEYVRVPTATVIAVDIDIENWGELDVSSLVSLSFVWRPKEIF